MKTYEAIKAFLLAQTCGARDLIEIYVGELECQVNVTEGTSRNGGIHEDDEGNRWWNIRIPKDASTVPRYQNREQEWPLDKRAQAIGLTGWDWQARRSRWVGFDFDSITGHAKGVGISRGELDAVKARAQALDYVQTRRSTGGDGLHLYVYCDVPTDNHTEHAALGRAILDRMSRDADFDFTKSVDAWGKIMWVWRRGMPSGGLSVIKEHTRTLDDIPTNWRDHLPVVQRKAGKVVVTGAADGLDELTGAYTRVPLDDTHRRVMSELAKAGGVSIWTHDHYLLQTHTAALKAVHESLGLRGMFDTNSPATDLQSPNCFAFPTENGGWRVYRFSQGTHECSHWQQDGQGWTTTAFNTTPTLDEAASVCNGIQRPTGEWLFDSYDDAKKTLTALGVDAPDAPNGESERNTALEYVSDVLAIYVDMLDQKEQETPPWKKRKKGQQFEYNTHLRRTDAPQHNRSDLDGIVRSVCFLDGTWDGFRMLTNDGSWKDIGKNRSIATDHLTLHGIPRPGQSLALGQINNEPWTMVSIPFDSEYPGDRQWNLGAPQLAVTPATEHGPHPSWDTVFNHVGKSLDGKIRNFGTIVTGGEYLQAYVAAIIQDPLCRLPFLFLFGPENSGKSIFHESVSQLFTSGVVRAGRSLTDQNGFNGELEGAVLCIVEELNITKNRSASGLIKDYVTGQLISIRPMRKCSYDVANTTHWIQCANDITYCPVFPDDTRITVCKVCKPAKDIPKDELINRLKIESPFFLRTLLDFEIPFPTGRLRIPVVETDNKHNIQETNEKPLAEFIREKNLEEPGAVVLVADLYKALNDWLPWETEKYKIKRTLTELTAYECFKDGNRWKVRGLSLGNVNMEIAP